MQRIALVLLLVMGVIFAVSYGLQDRYPWLTFVRAAAEGGMVGGLADWFAITALFRKPLGLPIPHTNLVSTKKDDIGEGLGSFIEENFLADEVIHQKLSTIEGARRAGTWVSEPENARKVTAAGAQAALVALDFVSDRDVQQLFEDLLREHLIESNWSPVVGRAAEGFFAAGHHQTIVDMAAEHLEQWVSAHPEVFSQLVAERMPSWVPSIVDRFVDQRLHREVLGFLRDIQDNTQHPFRGAVDTFLYDLAKDLQQKPELIEQLHQFGHDVFASERVRELVDDVWLRVREVVTLQLRDEVSPLRQQVELVLIDFGRKLGQDPTLQYKIDVWVMRVVEQLVRTYRHDLASVITDTVQKWDATEAAEKIELQIGKDLQYIRINGTVVGALAGLAITGIAAAIQSLAG